MDTRKRVLIVEDHDGLRGSYAASLERANYRVTEASDLQAAQAAIDHCAYHAVLVDIMLAGPKDTSNRDGVKVLDLLLTLREGTRAIVLSAQDNTQLVRDFLKDHDAFDYVSKRAISDGGGTLLLDTVQRAVAQSQVGKDPTWEQAVAAFAPGWTETKLVSNCLSFLEFKGGFENLSRSVTSVVRNLYPLVPPIDIADSLSYDKELRVFCGKYWSRAEVTGVEILMFGTNSAPSVSDACEERLRAGTTLFSSNKGGLSLVAFGLPAIKRDCFIRGKQIELES